MLVSKAVEMEILYEYFDFIEMVRKHMVGIVPLRSQRKKEQLINFYQKPIRPDSAKSKKSKVSGGSSVSCREKSKEIQNSFSSPKKGVEKERLRNEGIALA